MKKTKMILLGILLIWLIPVLFTGIVLPAFHKPTPRLKKVLPRDPSVQEYVGIVDDNREAMLRRLQIIRSAREELVLSTYYFADDDAGRDVMAALLEASRRGVHVRILVDGMCDFTSHVSKSESFQSLVYQDNVEAKIYNPVNLLVPWDENYRMHDKYLVADQKVYILGGRNTRNKSIGDYPGDIDADRDALVYSENGGGSVSELLSYFESVWDSPYCKNVKVRKSSPDEEILLSRLEQLKASYPEASEPADFTSMTQKADSIRLLTNPMEAWNKAPQLWTELLNLMGQGSDIEIQTPYIILGRQMYRDFSDLNKGRDIKIITNAPESGANPMGCAELLNRKKYLLKTGFELCEYSADRSAHVKTMVIDDNISIVGSFNFDMRSAYLDTETMLVIESREINRSLRETNSKYLSSSRCSAEGREELVGPYFPEPKMGSIKLGMYAVLRALIVPVRHLL